MRFKKILVVLLALTMVLGVMASCKKKSNDNQETAEPLNETRTLIIQESTFDGVFNPFFYSSAYDGDVVGMVNVGLTTMERDGSIVAGNQYDTVGLSYEIFYTDNLETLAKKDTYEEGNYVVYEVVLKNGAKFSDGTAITADDVLFNWYVFLDPAYTGSSTFYTLPILGLNDYRTQVAGYDAIAAAASAALKMGPDAYVASEEVTEEQYNFYWTTMGTQLKAFAQSIVDYVNTKYADYVKSYFYPEWAIADVTGNTGREVAFGMSLWGFGNFAPTGFKAGVDYYVIDEINYVEVAAETAFNAEETYFTKDGEDYAAAADLTEFAAGTTYYTQVITYKANTEAFDEEETYFVLDEGKYVDATVADFENSFFGASGKEYNVEAITIDDYVYELTNAYIHGVDYATEYFNLDDTEKATVTLLSPVEEAFVAQFGTAAVIPNIAGLRKGTKTVNGEEHETFVMILNKQNPKAVLDLTITVAPKAYYTAGYTYTAGAMVNYGVELNNEAFMAHLHTLDSAPAGAGSYKFVKADGDGVTLIRNDYHYTLGDDTVTNALIKNVYLKVIEGGSEFNALKAGDVDYATPSADGDVVADIAKETKLTSLLVDNNGYGYICINPAAPNLDNIHTRIALTSVFDQNKMKDYYPEGLAEVIYRSQTQVSWAYPENATAIYPFDDTLATAIAEFKLAGYTYDEATGKFTDVPAFTFTLPSEAKDHPAGGIFLRAQELLATIGVEANIKVDTSLIANIKKSAVAVYALAWNSTADPDMYQVYHYLSSAESVTSNGIKYLHDNGNDATLGTIEVVKLDGTTVEMTQTAALDYLAQLIEEGLTYMSAEERAPIYQKALEVLAQLNIELPTYQRKNMFAYNNEIIDATTLSPNITPYWGPLAQIWKVSFKQA